MIDDFVLFGNISNELKRKKRTKSEYHQLVNSSFGKRNLANEMIEQRSKNSSEFESRHVNLHIPIFKININGWIDINTCWFFNRKKYIHLEAKNYLNNVLPLLIAGDSNEGLHAISPRRRRKKNHWIETKENEWSFTLKYCRKDFVQQSLKNEISSRKKKRVNESWETSVAHHRLHLLECIHWIDKHYLTGWTFIISCRLFKKIGDT